MIYSPLIFATLTSEIGPLKGMSETAKAAAAANPTKASGLTSESAEIRLMFTCVSAWKSSGNEGLNALSTKREIKIS